MMLMYCQKYGYIFLDLYNESRLKILYDSLTMKNLKIKVYSECNILIGGY